MKSGKNKSIIQQPPPIDKLLIPAIVVAIALVAYQFLKSINSEIKRVNVEDELEIREVFYGGEDGTSKTYVVLCHDENSKLPLSSVFQDAYKDGSAPAEFRVMDCNYVLPDSGKTIYDRFRFNLQERPTIFISGAKVEGEPQQIPVKHLKTGKMLVKVLKNKLEPRSLKIETTQDLRSKCLDRNICALLLKGSKKAPSYLKDAMAKLIVEYPKVTFATVDSTVLYAYNLEEYLPEFANEQPRFVVFRKVSGSTDPKGERLITSIATFETNGVSYGQMSNLVASVVSNTTTMTKLPLLPSIKIRSKKIESEERAKRERKLNRQQQQQDSSSSSSSSNGFASNDGSRDGRRAERERRRVQHAKANNVKPKTPEEIAEMERQRRIRMEEEAKKWNMAPEDLPPEGDPVYDDNNNNNRYYNLDDEDNESNNVMDDDDDNNNRNDNHHDDTNHDDGEDIIDLD